MQFPHTNIIFYDLPTTLPERRSTSNSCWRARLVLNYKQLAYETVWVEAPDITSNAIELGLPPTSICADGSERYTLPSIIDFTDPHNVVRISDSFKIIRYLEGTYPDGEKPLFPSAFDSAFSLGMYTQAPALYELLTHFIESTMSGMIRPLILLQMVSVQTPRGREYYETGMKQRLGVEITSIPPGAVGSAEWETAWAAVQPKFEALARLLQRNEQEGSGEFFMGSRPTFADFELCAQLIALRNASPEDAWGRIRTWSGGRWERFWNACEEYIVVR